MKSSIIVAMICAFAFFGVVTPSLVFGERIPVRGKWIFGVSGGVSMMTSDVGKGNGAVTKGKTGHLFNEKLLYGISDKMSVGMSLEWEEHDIENVAPVPLNFGRSGTLSRMVVVEVYPPLWPSFIGNYPLFPYGLIGLGQNRNFFTPSSAFSENCTPASSCKIRLENTLGIKVAAGVDYFIAPDLAINAEIGWKFNAGESRISTTDSAGNIIDSRDGYEASTASFLVGLRYFFKKPNPPPPPPPMPVAPPQLEPTIEASPPPIETKSVPQELWVTKELFFEFNSWSISSEGYAFLLDAAASLKSSPKIPIEIEGHTDLRGSKEGNIWIGQKRAEAVEEILTKAGVTNAMRVISYGDIRPISRDDTPEADRLNRRVTIRRIVPKE